MFFFEKVTTQIKMLFRPVTTSCRLSLQTYQFLYANKKALLESGCWGTLTALKPKVS